MRIEAACFTQRGQELGEKLLAKLASPAASFHLTRCGGDGPPVHEWAAEHFAAADALLFIGAAGIAVRAIASHVASKTSDPAVIVMDEGANYVVPLLSGHIGGANALAKQMGALLGAGPVITTATDVTGVFAVDTWATEHGYHIQNPEQIKNVSAKLLRGELVSLYSEFAIEDALPMGVVSVSGEAQANIGITICDEKARPDTLWLTPPTLVLGAGCRKGIAESAVEMAFSRLCAQEGLHPDAFGLVCSITIKKDEPGLLAFCHRHGWPLHTFAADELANVPGVYTASPFVEETTGVDNVCERSAVLGSGGALLVKKIAENGVTLAAAKKQWTVRFEAQP